MTFYSIYNAKMIAVQQKYNHGLSVQVSTSIMCLTMKKWQQINTGLAQNIYFFFLSLLVFRKNLNNSNWKTKKNLFWNSKIIVVRYFRTMYLYQHFKNRAVSITSDFPPHIIALIAPSQLPLNWNFLFHYFATVLTL